MSKWECSPSPQCRAIVHDTPDETFAHHFNLKTENDELGPVDNLKAAVNFEDQLGDNFAHQYRLHLMVRAQEHQRLYLSQRISVRREDACQL